MGTPNLPTSRPMLSRSSAKAQPLCTGASVKRRQRSKEIRYPAVIARVVGRNVAHPCRTSGVRHRTIKARNTKRAHDHRRIKSWYKPMKSFKTSESASRFRGATAATYGGPWVRHPILSVIEKIDQFRDNIVNKKRVWQQSLPQFITKKRDNGAPVSGKILRKNRTARHVPRFRRDSRLTVHFGVGHS